jgi:hypothetical protein
VLKAGWAVLEAALSPLQSETHQISSIMPVSDWIQETIWSTLGAVESGAKISTW